MVDGKMLADVAQEIEEADWRGPGGIIQQPRWIGLRFEVEQLSELLFVPGDVGVEHFLREQLPLLALPLGSPIEPVAPPASAMG